MQENYDSDSPAKILGLYQKGKKALKGVKRIYKSITGTKKKASKKYTNKNPYDIERYGKKFDTKMKSEESPGVVGKVWNWLTAPQGQK